VFSNLWGFFFKKGFFMAKSVSWKPALIVFGMICLLGALPAFGVVDRVGTLGDSITDLQIPPNLTSYQPWTKWCVETIGVNFGTYASWPDFRETDYQYNYARGGATTASMISDGQHTLLAAENPRVNVATLLNGANDLAYHFQNHALWVYLQDGQNPSVIVPGMNTNCATAMNTVAGPVGSPTGTDMLLFGCPDITRMPQVANNLWAAWPGSATKYRNAATSFNTTMRNTASSRGWVYLDMIGFQNSLMGTPSSPKKNFVLAGVTIPMANMFCSDGIHPGPVFSGLLANLFINGINRMYGTTFSPMTDQQILTAAGYTPTPGATYYNVAPYAIMPPGH
jgi:hypothetical protein